MLNNMVNMTTSFNLVHCKYLIISAVFYTFEVFYTKYNSNNNYNKFYHNHLLLI